MSGVKEASCYSSSTISQLWYLLDESNQLSTPLDAKSSQDGISGSGSIFGTPFFDRLFAGRSFKLEIPAKIINHLDNYKLLIKKEHIHKLLFLLSSIKNSFFNKKKSLPLSEDKDDSFLRINACLDVLGLLYSPLIVNPALIVGSLISKCDPLSVTI